MATYKVLQDIEAEDKFIGPLTLKQFIFAGIAAICLYISVFALTKGVWIIALILLPFIGMAGFLAWPWISDQPTEVWLLAKIRFFFKPRRRVWDQSGQADLVTITAPKRTSQTLVNNLSQTEVKSRLRALADTIDSRGWAVKNVNVNLYAEPGYALPASDRLIDVSALPQEVPTVDVLPADDILDPRNNRVAAQLDQMMNASVEAHRQEALKRMQKPESTHKSAKKDEIKPNYWFMDQPPSGAVPPSLSSFGTHMVSDDAATQMPINPTPEDLALLAKIKAEKVKPVPSYGNTKVIQPLNKRKSASKAHRSEHKQNHIPTTPDPGILGLAINDDLNVATIAREANRTQQKQSGNDEVVVPLR